jgi:hypothetical protein
MHILQNHSGEEEMNLVVSGKEVDKTGAWSIKGFGRRKCAGTFSCSPPNPMPIPPIPPMTKEDVEDVGESNGNDW